MDCPLFEEDFASEGVIEPARVVPEVDMPERAVLCFFSDVVNDVVAARADAHQITTLVSEAGPTPVWSISVGDTRLAVFQPGVGAPMAGAFFEEVIAMGARRVVACGGAGALVPELALGHAVVVDGAIRDEGTSHHYLPPRRVIDADSEVTDVIAQVLETTGLAHTAGRSWTTDAIYRETRERVARRISERCLTVEMEAAALFAIAHYRKIRFGQLLLAGDSLASDTWDDRGWMSAHDARRRLFWAAADAAVAL